ncbi:hypothetical protein D1Z98_09530 [Riemerella anatipestifer]|uniref:hypothetical protein n=1 Tax=Riemerella anatipestifer TaxID=34085 RepID=UPI000D6862E7|nr:hypothetical protein [Riemerella anatipestifer]MRM86282.1 hypothetical protein [Riemerella anatipestifer]MRM95194.1 hypothetical protein [Riemerella anatipestifer]
MDYETIEYHTIVKVDFVSIYPKYSSGDLVVYFFQLNKIYVLDRYGSRNNNKRESKSTDKGHLLLVGEPPMSYTLSWVNDLSLVVGVRIIKMRY